ncbi:MAG: hypothetical protein ACO2PK_13795 [Armatimonadota bacterium]
MPCATPSAKSPAISLPVETAATGDWRLATGKLLEWLSATTETAANSDWRIATGGNGSE